MTISNARARDQFIMWKLTAKKLELDNAAPVEIGEQSVLCYVRFAFLRLLTRV